MSIFDPSVDYLDSLDVPCTNWLHFTVRDDKLDLSVAVRSNDIMWGFSGINTFEWSVVQEMMAHWIGVTGGQVNYFISSLHLYDHHFERAARIVASAPTKSPYDEYPAAPRFSTAFASFDQVVDDWFGIEKGIRGGADVAEPIRSFTDPLLRDFLRMLDAYWAFKKGDVARTNAALDSVEDRALAASGADFIRWTTAPTDPGPSCSPPTRISKTAIERWLTELHRTKSEGYGNSWKRRGEQMAIMANVARKIDRLARHDDSSPARGEEIIDTAADLLVYSLKPPGGETWSDGTDGFEVLIGQVTAEKDARGHAEAAAEVLAVFEQLERTFTPDTGPVSRRQLVASLSVKALELLRFHLDNDPAAAYRLMAAEE